jgi:geranylgeranyl transferase type-2 subunit beta
MFLFCCASFSYCVLNCLSLLNRLHLIDLPKAVEFVLRCQNFDGGFGSMLDAESHAGQIFCCVGALAIADALYKVRVS